VYSWLSLRLSIWREGVCRTGGSPRLLQTIRGNGVEPAAMSVADGDHRHERLGRSISAARTSAANKSHGLETFTIDNCNGTFNIFLKITTADVNIRDPM